MDRAAPGAAAGRALRRLTAHLNCLTESQPYDHCDRATLRKLSKRFNPLVVTPLGNERLVRSAGIQRVEELDWWETSTSGSHEVTSTPAHHFAARTPFDRNRALWSGFTVRVGKARIYFAGDTAYAGFFQEVPRRLGPIDLALLPIGAYEPRWFMQTVHMNPAEAVQAHLELDAARSIAMHFGTFQLTSEGGTRRRDGHQVEGSA